MKKLLLLACLFCLGASAQNLSTSGTISAASTANTCTATSCVYYQLPSGATWVTLQIAGTWSGSVGVYSVTSQNATYQNLNSQTWTQQANLTANGTWAIAAGNSTFILVQSSSFSSGFANITMTASSTGSPLVNPILAGNLTVSGISQATASTSSQCWSTQGGVASCGYGPGTVVPVVSGGTGAITSTAALTNLFANVTCTSGQAYSPFSGTCINPTASAPGTSGQLLYNDGGVTGAAPGITTDGNGLAASSGIVSGVPQWTASQPQRLSISGSLGTGPATAPYQILLAGNSKVIGNNTFAGSSFCNNLNANDALFNQDACRGTVSYSSASNIVTLVMTDNSDGYIQSGDRFSFASYFPYDPCLYGSFTASAVSGNTITFDSSSAISPCGNVSSTATTNINITKTIQLFGMNGAPLSSWVSSTGPYGGVTMLAYAQSLIAKGITPIIWMADGGISTNSIRTGGTPYLTQLNAIKAFLKTLNTTYATRPDGTKVSLGSYPVYMDNGNQMGNAGTAWAATQYVFPDGTTGSNLTTAPVAVSATQGGTPVTTLAAGTQAIVTLSYCPDEIWSPGMAQPTQVNYAGQLEREGNLMQVVVDTSGSGVQETATLQLFNAGTGTAVTGVAPGAASTVYSNYLQCQISFTPANAHTVANLPIVGTRQTADQAYSTWLARLPYDAAAFAGNVVPVDFQNLIYGHTSISSDTSFYGPNDELHPKSSGYIEQTRIMLATLAPIVNAPNTTIEQARYGYLPDIGVTYNNDARPIIPTFSEDKATTARKLGTYIAPSTLMKDWCLSDVTYATVMKGELGAAGSGYLRVYSPMSSVQPPLSRQAQTGDVIWTAQMGCWQPTTISAPYYFYTNETEVNTSGNPPLPYANWKAGQTVLIRRPVAVDSSAWPFLGNPLQYPVHYNATIVSTGTSTFTISLNANQPAGVPSGITASQISLQTGDSIVIQGGGSVPVGGQVYILPVGTSTVSGTNLVWTDSSGTAYIGSGQQAQIFISRVPDQVAFKASSVDSRSISGYNTSGSPIPAAPADPYYPTTGSCAAGTYYYKVAYQPLGNPTGQAGIASPPSHIVIPSGTTNYVSVRWKPISGYQVLVYGRTSGSYNYIGTVPYPTSYFSDGCTVTPNASYPALSTDNSVTGNMPYDAGAPSAAGQLIQATGAGSRLVTWTSSPTLTSLTLGSDSAIHAGPRGFMQFATGQLAAVVTGGQYFAGSIAQNATIENFVATAGAFTCTTNPTITLEDCGTSAGACASPTALASITLTAANTITAGTVSSPTLTAGHYFTVETTAGACTILNATGSAEYKMQ